MEQSVIHFMAISQVWNSLSVTNNASFPHFSANEHGDLQNLFILPFRMGAPQHSTLGRCFDLSRQEIGSS